MSGIDEQHVDVSECPICGEFILTWRIYQVDKEVNIGRFNCTDKYTGPDYYHMGSVNDIFAFKCCECDAYIKRGTSFFSFILRNMLKARRLKRERTG